MTAHTPKINDVISIIMFLNVKERSVPNPVIKII